MRIYQEIAGSTPARIKMNFLSVRRWKDKDIFGRILFGPLSMNFLSHIEAQSTSLISSM